MKKAIVAILTLVMLISTLSFTVSAEVNREDIIILYENDVHCAVEGYSKIAAMKEELKETYEYVGVVSSGDYIQGASLGIVSKGEYIVRLQNLVGYDALTLGNHEFDYHIPRLNELISMMNTKPVCCNFFKVGETEPYFKPYSIVTYGNVKIAYVGITTPSTIKSSSPAQFKDENGEYIYTFNPLTLAETVQGAVDSAKAEGADYVVALSHSGDKEPMYTVDEIAKATTGIDVFLDGHSHSVIESLTLQNKAGKDVIITSTGTKFEYIGKLTISDDGIKTELVSMENYEKTNSEVDACIEDIKSEYSELGNRVVATSSVDLRAYDENGKRLVRISETNLGDLCSDAFKYVSGADIGFVNGGGLRANVDKGEITFNDLLTLYPFNNTVVVSEVKGQVIKDLLEFVLMSYPDENGSFPHVSGLTFCVNTAMPSSVVINEKEEFVAVDGEYRVYNIKVLDKESGEYKPLDLDGVYTFAINNFYVPELGEGVTMFKDAKNIQDTGILDVEAVEKYITEKLGGVVGDEYKEVSPNITFTEGFVTDDEPESDVEPSTPGDNGEVVIWGISLFASILLAATVAKRKLLRRNSR